MCLSTVYKIEKKPENEVLRNVMRIECKDGVVTLTDIRAGKLRLRGKSLPRI